MKFVVLLTDQTMKKISTTEFFARLTRNLTSAVSRSLFTITLIFTLLFSFGVGETFAATWMEEPSIVINGETKTASSLTNDHWGTQTDLKISWVHWYGKRNNKDSDAMWAEGKFAYGVAGTTSASWTDVRLTSGSWYDDYKTYYVNQDINLQLCANRKPGDYEIYFYFAHRTGDNNYLYYSNSSANYHVYWTIPDPTISFTSNHTPVKGQPVTLSTSVSNWAYGMTIKSVTYKHNGTAISTNTSGDLSSTSYTHTPTVAGTGKYTVEVVCTYGSAGDVTYTESINVTDSYTVTYGSHTNGSFTIAVPNVSASSSSKNAASGQRVDISATGNTGYEFSAWNVYNTSTPATKVSTNSSDATTYFTMPAYAVTVDATFVGKYYDVTLDPDNGSSTSAIYPQYASSMPSTLKGGGALSAPTYTGYTFGGYYDERAGAGTQYYTNTMSSANNWNKASNTTLYAKWTPNTYTITLNSNGGTGSTASVEIVYGQTPPNTDDLGNHYFSITNPTKPGYTFLGWFTAADGGDLVINIDSTFNANVAGYTSTSPGNIWIHPNNATLYAHWEQTNLALNKTAYAGWSRTVTEKNDGEVPSKAVDGNLSSQHIQWNINDNFATKGWWGVDLGDNYVLSDLYIYWQAGEDGRAPRYYEIQATVDAPTDFSNDHAMDDDMHWHTIKTISGVAQNLGSTPNIISFTSGEHVTARYVRIVNKDASRKPMAIAEFQAYAYDVESCSAANTPTASFAGIEGGRIKLNLAATNANSEALTNFAVLYDGIYYDVTASAGVGYVTLPSHRDITVRVYAYNTCMQRSSGYVEVEVGDYVNPQENLAELKTTWVSYTNNNNDEKQANLNDGVLDTKGWIPYQNTGKNAWMVVDLGDTYQISTIQTFFATGRRSTNYKIYGRQNDPSTDDVRGDNTKWVELASKSSSINAGATESDVNESAVSFTGAVRYVRFESFAEEWDDVANGFKLLEFRVFGSAFKSADVTGPVISTCEIDASAENVTSTVLHLVATDAVDGEVFNYEISTDGGSNWTKYSTDPVTRLVTITDLTSGSYTFTVRAYDVVGNYSANSTVSVDIWNPAANLALNKTSWAGHETGGAGEAKDKANDGSLTTFWTSWDGANPGDDWWCVDLGNYYQLSEIDVFWHQIDGPINLHSEKYTIRARQNLSGTASEMEAIMRDSTQWYTIVRQSTTPNVGNTESNKNAYSSLNTPARYLLLKSTQRNALNQQIRLSEFRAYGSGFAAADTHVPVISSATASYNDDGKAYLTLTATDTEDGTVRLFRIYNPYTETYSLQQTNGSNQIVIDGLPTCTDYTFRIQAMDKAAQLSEVTNLVVNVPLISTTNLAPLATITSGTNSGAGLRNLVNGNTADTWEVADGTIAGDNEWVTFQWEHPYEISTVKVYWETHAGGGTRPKDYEWQVSNDGTHFVPVLHYTTKPGAEETYTINTTAQYIRLFVNKHDQYNGMCLREVEMRGGCAEDSDLPIMLFAEVKLEEIFRTNAKVHVGAIHKTIPSNELLYHVIVNNGTPITITAGQVVDNYITISGLTKETAYNVKIYAAKISDTEENRSANYKEVNFTTQGDYSDYYLANSINGWLAVNGGEWTDAMNAWRFRTTDVDGIYNLTHAVSVTENWTYLIYNRATGTRTPGDRTASVVAGRDFKAVMHDLDHYVTNYSNLYIAGTAVGTAENTRSEQNRLTWIDAIHAVWEGRVTNGGTFRITSYDNVLQTNFITPTAQTYNEGYSHARLTFTFDEEANFTWTWEELPSEQFCSRSGGAGSGAVLDGGSAFGVGESYSVYAYMSAGGKWIVEATCSGIEAANAYLQPFTSLAGDGRQEFAMAKIDNYFRVEIDPASINYKLNNLARYVVKFAVPAGIRYTDVHYYDFTGSGECAPDFFDIYHHDDAAAAPEGARTSFDGGVIMQPIRYFRHFDNPDWTTVCVPFNVSKVTVYDTGDERDYSLYPRFNNGTEDVEGYYWLKTFSEALPITSFESAWEQLTVNTDESDADVLTTLVKPAKNTPYIIAFPDGNGYYTTNWVVFHGAAGQTIDSEFTGQSSIALTDGYDYSQVQLQGNNTMHQSSTLTNIYTIDEGDDYFTRKTVAVPAFEAYLIGTAQVQASYAAVRYRGGQSVPTGVDNLPSTGDMQGSIYTATGVRVASFDGRDAMEHYLNHLSTGVYVVYTQSQVNKIVIP